MAEGWIEGIYLLLLDHSDKEGKDKALGKSLEASLGEEESIPSGITLHLFLVILFGVEFLPNAGREDMFVALIPPTINDFRKGWIIMCAFDLQYPVGFYFGICFVIRVGGICWIGYVGGSRFGAVVEEDTVVRTQRVVYYKVIEIIMLCSMLARSHSLRKTQ